MTKKKIEGKYRIFNDSKKAYFECIPEKEAFQFFKCCIHFETDKN